MASSVRLLAAAFATALVACSAASAPVESVAETDQPIATESPTPLPTPTEQPSATPAPTPSPTPNWAALPVAANDPDALAQQLAMVEAAIRDPNVSGAQLAYVGHLQQLVYGRLQDYPDWKEAVLATLPEQTRDAVKGSLEAGRQLRLLSGPIPRTLPDWRIVQAAPIEQLLSYYKEAEATFGVGWQYLAAIHLVETRMGRIRGLSSAGAQGPMQFMPGTWAAYGKGDINDSHDAILAAARYLKVAGAPGDMRKALYAYNHSYAYVNALLAYSEVMRANANAYRGYHGWQVYYPTRDGPVLLPVGWTKPAN